eukprot:1500375-Amphidinium_carterae.1
MVYGGCGEEHSNECMRESAPLAAGDKALTKNASCWLQEKLAIGHYSRIRVWERSEQLLQLLAARLFYCFVASSWISGQQWQQASALLVQCKEQVAAMSNSTLTNGQSNTIFEALEMDVVLYGAVMSACDFSQQWRV